MRFKNLFPIFLLLFHPLLHADSRGRTKIKASDGISLISPLLEGAQENTTNLRVEEKNILDIKQINTYLKPFLGEGPTKRKVQFSFRDKKLKNQKSLTQTIYGKKIYFWNDRIKTNIKLRARVYLKQKKSGAFKRIKKLKHLFFLELKLKNANPSERNVSRKLRFLVSDKALERLYRANPKSPSFSLELKKLGASLLETNPKKTKQEVEKFLRAVKKFTRIDPEFVKPLYVVEYSRVGYKLGENYEHKNLLGKTLDQKEIEYQVTMDKDIKIYKIDESRFLNSGLKQYIKKEIKQDLLYQYEDNLRVIEFKYPKLIQDRSYQRHSSVYKELKKHFAFPLFEHINPYGNYERNKGKLATATKMAEKKKEENK